MYVVSTVLCAQCADSWGPDKSIQLRTLGGADCRYITIQCSSLVQSMRPLLTVTPHPPPLSPAGTHNLSLTRHCRSLQRCCSPESLLSRVGEYTFDLIIKYDVSTWIIVMIRHIDLCAIEYICICICLYNRQDTTPGTSLLMEAHMCGLKRRRMTQQVVLDGIPEAVNGLGFNYLLWQIIPLGYSSWSKSILQHISFRLVSCQFLQLNSKNSSDGIATSPLSILKTKIVWEMHLLH